MIRDKMRSEDVLFAFGCFLYGLIAVAIILLIVFLAHYTLAIAFSPSNP